MHPFRGTSIVDEHSISPARLEIILDEAERMKRALASKNSREYRLCGPDANHTAVLLFAEPSTRTHQSFAVAAQSLGMHVREEKGTATNSLSKGESLIDTARMFQGYGASVIVLRHPLEGAARYVSLHQETPVVNGGDGAHSHPTQMLLDLYTMREHLRNIRGPDAQIEDVDVGFGGDLRHSRVVRSNIHMLSQLPGVRFHFFSHELLSLPQYILDDLTERGIPTQVYDSLEELLPNVTMFTQLRSQLERQSNVTLQAMQEEVWHQTRLWPEHMELLREDAIFTHPLPIYRLMPEIHPDLGLHPKARFYQAAANGVPVRMAVMGLCTGLIEADLDEETSTQTRASHYQTMSPGNRRKTSYSVEPISNGVVVDHLPLHAADTVKRLLRVREREYRTRGGNVYDEHDPRGDIDLLMIEGMEQLSRDEELAIAAVAPGTRVSIIKDGRAVEKRELLMPSRVNGPYFQCPNYNSERGTGCISRPEFHENAQPEWSPVRDPTEHKYSRALACNWCGTVGKGEDLVRPHLK